MCDAFELISTEPSQRLNIVTDLYRLLLDRLHLQFVFFLLFYYFVVLYGNIIEGLLNSNSGVMRVLQKEKIQQILGDIVVNDSDPLLLVWHLNYFCSFF